MADEEKTEKKKKRFKLTFPKKKKKRKHRRKKPLGVILAELFGNIVKSALILAVCFVMITPLQSCVFTDEGFIGASKAQSIAVEDAGLVRELAGNMETDMVHIEDAYYYKIDFSGAVTDYHYIIDAVTGKIIAQAAERVTKG